MGKYVLLMVFATALGLAYFSQQSYQTAQATSKERAERQEVVLARQIARSAFNKGMSRVKRGVGEDLLDLGQEDVRYEGGEFDLAYSNLETKIIDKINWKRVDITAEGRFPVEEPQTTYRITATARQAISEDVSAITAGESVQFDPKGPGCKKCINGSDAAGGEDRAGVTLPPDGDPQSVCDAFKNGNGGGGKGKGNNNGGGGGGGVPIIGAGDGCSVEKRSDDRDGEVDRVMEAIEDRILDSEDSPTVEIYDGGDIENNTTPEDPGILYIEEGEEAKMSQDWHGVVFISSSGGEESEGGFEEDSEEDIEAGQLTLNGNTSINGSVLMDKGAKFRLNGGGKGSGKTSNIQYNTSSLLGLVDVLPMLGEPVEITDRRGEVVRNEAEVPN